MADEDADSSRLANLLTAFVLAVVLAFCVSFTLILGMLLR